MPFLRERYSMPFMDASTLYALSGIIGLALLSVLYQVLSARKKRRLEEKMASKPKVIDVRTPKEYRQDHFPGAGNIPLQKLYLDPKKVGPKDKTIVLYCQSGGRARRAKRILKAYGYKDVTNGGGLSKIKGFAE